METSAPPFNFPKIVVIDNSNFFNDIADYIPTRIKKCIIYKTKVSENAVSICEKLNPDIIILDYCLPTMDSVQLVKDMSLAKLHPKIILISNQQRYQSPLSHETYRSYRALATFIGADAILTRTSIKTELPAAINNLLIGWKTNVPEYMTGIDKIGGVSHLIL